MVLVQCSNRTTCTFQNRKQLQQFFTETPLFSLVVIATHKEDDGGDEDDEDDEELPEDELNTSKAKNRKKSGNVSFAIFFMKF